MWLSLWHHRLFVSVSLTKKSSGVGLHPWLGVWVLCAAMGIIILPHRSSIKSSKWGFGFINEVLQSWVTENPLSGVWSPLGYVVWPLWASESHLWNDNLKYYLFYLSCLIQEKKENTSKRANIKNNKIYKH